MPKFGSALQMLRQAIPTSNPASGYQTLFADSTGWLQARSSAGVITSVGPQVVRLMSDQSTTSASASSVPGMGFTVESDGLYVFRYAGVYISAINTTAVRLGISAPTAGAEGVLSWNLVSDSSAGTSQTTSATGGFDTHNQASGTGPAGTFEPFWLEGSYHAGSSGTLALRFWSEVATSFVTVKRGSYGMLWRVS